MGRFVDVDEARVQAAAGRSWPEAERRRQTELKSYNHERVQILTYVFAVNARRESTQEAYNPIVVTFRARSAIRALGNALSILGLALAAGSRFRRRYSVLILVSGSAFACNLVDSCNFNALGRRPGYSGLHNSKSTCAAAQPAATDTAALAKATQNPVASLISVPLQNNSNFGIALTTGLGISSIFSR